MSSTDNEHGAACLTREDAKVIVKETLVALGVDMENPIEFQADARFVRKLRRAHETVGTKILVSFVGLIVTGTCALVLLGVSSWMKTRV